MQKHPLLKSMPKMANTNCLNREEHDELMIWLKSKNHSAPLSDYLMHLLDQGKYDTLEKLNKSNS